MIKSGKKHEVEHKHVHVEEVTTGNYPEIVDLTVKRSQHFISNRDSMAYAYAVVAEGHFARALGIYDGETPVGYAMIGRNIRQSEEGTEVYGRSYDLWHLMIDKRYQGQGYGREGLKCIVDYMLTLPDREEDYLYTSYIDNDLKAKNLYLSFGFVPNGETCGHEVTLVLPVNEPRPRE